MTNSNEFPEYAPSHKLLFFLSIVLTLIFDLLFKILVSEQLLIVYQRSIQFYIVEEFVFIFGLLIVIAIFIYYRKENKSVSSIINNYLLKQIKIDTSSAKNILNSLKSLDHSYKNTIYLYRTINNLQFFITTENPAETDNYNSKISQLVKDNYQTNFEYVRYCIWIIPIIGFIGTLWGITLAVAGFSDLLSKVTPGEESTTLLGSLRLISTNLSTAFETTLPALVTSGILALLLSMLDRATDRLILKMDKSQVDQLISKLIKVEILSADHFKGIKEKLDSIFSEQQLNETQRMQLSSLLIQFNSIETEINDYKNISELVKKNSLFWEKFISKIDKSTNGIEELKILLNKILQELDELKLILQESSTNLNQQTISQTEYLKSLNTQAQTIIEEGIPLALEINSNFRKH